MSNITITIDTDNDTFTDGHTGTEVSRILQGFADSIAEYDAALDMHGITLRDINGNRVGNVRVSE